MRPTDLHHLVYQKGPEHNPQDGPVSAVDPEAVKVGRVPQVEKRLRHAEEEEAEVEVGQHPLQGANSTGFFRPEIWPFKKNKGASRHDVAIFLDYFTPPLVRIWI